MLALAEELRSIFFILYIFEKEFYFTCKNSCITAHGEIYHHISHKLFWKLEGNFTSPVHFGIVYCIKGLTSEIFRLKINLSE